MRGQSGIFDSHLDPGKSDTPLSSTPRDRGLLYHLDREISMSGTVRPKKAVSPPSIFYSKENKQGELVVRKRSRGQRDRDRNRLLQIKQSPTGLYDDSVSEPSDASSVPDDMLSVFKNMTKEELLRVVITSKAQMIRKDQYIRDLENYIDDLLVRVMEITPRLLTRPQPIHRF
ncbi:unnamed protein product [Candidula unifasciata]|uniref:FIP-RBD domain-containing protein n=1 Tax=Candidula unifasciata TaxID=100452 RepID=A0A8S3ZC16_9EUPU|nr:unnamed protein product [Candidula unifasciata]